MIAAFLAVFGAFVLLLVLPAPLCVLALVPAVVAGWLWGETVRGRWNP